MSENASEILKAELEDGYGRIANLLLEALSMSKLNGKQMSICLFIIRRTYSWGKKSDEIALKEFALACDSSETYMSKQLKQLIEWKVVKRKNYSPGKVPEYEINTRVDEWDKGCLNVQGLNENIKQGLYNQARVPLNKRTRVVQGQSIENTSVEECLKESIKENRNKDTTNNIANKYTKTGSKDISVADMGAGPIQQDSPCSQIEEYYFLKVKRRCSGKDFNDIYKTYQKYKDLDFIFKVMDMAVERNIKTHGRLTINSFNYFEQIFEEEWEKEKIKKEVVKNGSIAANSKQNIKFDKSKFLWNGGENSI